MKLEDKSVLVAGGAGFIGSHLVDRLIQEKPSKIIVVDNFFLGKNDNLEQAKNKFSEIKVYNEDCANQEKIKEIIKENKVNVVFNWAVIPLLASLEQPKWSYAHNINITMSFCELLRKKEYDTLIQCSSSEAYGTAKQIPMTEEHPLDPTTPYAASKAASDLLVNSYNKTFGLDTVIIRPFNNYGPRQNEFNYAGVIPLTIKRIMNNKAPVIYGSGKQTRDYIYVTDTVDATVKAYNCEKTRGKIINIASGKEIEIGWLIEEISKKMGFEVSKILHEDERKGDVDRHLGGIKLAEELIGFSPKVDFEKGIKETIKWYAEHPNRGREDLVGYDTK